MQVNIVVGLRHFGGLIFITTDFICSWPLECDLTDLTESAI